MSVGRCYTKYDTKDKKYPHLRNYPSSEQILDQYVSICGDWMTALLETSIEFNVLTETSEKLS